MVCAITAARLNAQVGSSDQSADESRNAIRSQRPQSRMATLNEARQRSNKRPITAR